MLISSQSPVTVKVSTRGARDKIEGAPRRYASAFTSGAGAAVSRYRGFHRQRRMNRRSSADPVGVYATRRGIKNNTWAPVKRLRAKEIARAGAEIVVKNRIIKQLERGAVIRSRTGRSMAVPFSQFQRRGQATKVAKRWKAENKLIYVRTDASRAFLMYRKRGKKRMKHGKGRRMTPVYTLVPVIKIGPRLQFRKLFGTAYFPEVLKQIEKAMQRTTDSINRARLKKAGEVDA